MNAITLAKKLLIGINVRVKSLIRKSLRRSLTLKTRFLLFFEKLRKSPFLV